MVRELVPDADKSKMPKISDDKDAWCKWLGAQKELETGTIDSILENHGINEKARLKWQRIQAIVNKLESDFE